LGCGKREGGKVKEMTAQIWRMPNIDGHLDWNWNGRWRDMK
jgi:hypothetical protein